MGGADRTRKTCSGVAVEVRETGGTRGAYPAEAARTRIVAHPLG